MGQLVLNTLSQTLGNFFNALALFLPRVLSMVVIIVAGFLGGLSLLYTFGPTRLKGISSVLFFF